MGHLANVHAFHWGVGPRRRLPLADGEQLWIPYLRRIRSTGRDHFVMLEFVEDDSPEALRRDAATLKGWLDAVR